MKIARIVLCMVFLVSCIPADEPSRIERLENNPIIQPQMLSGSDGENINGPSLIRVPDWVRDPLGKYYLYFAHHLGQYIRLAYADKLEGPWTVYAPGTLPIESTICDALPDSEWALYKHLASPDVLVDEAARRIHMYFHCLIYDSGPPESLKSYRQVSLVATSSDGIHFDPQDVPLGNSYFRVFHWKGATYALGMPGTFYRSDNGLHDFVEGPTLFTADMRHSAVMVRRDKLFVFYSNVGDNPERILLSRIDLTPDWTTWQESDPIVVLEPEMEWEGASLPLEPSVRGAAMEPVRQLRDPAIFVEGCRTYMLYSVAGEQGIAIARIYW